jgi:hypothetical protein
MNIDKIRGAIHRQPFLPFNVRTVDGRVYEVRDPDFISTSRNGRRVYVDDDEGHHILDVRLIPQMTIGSQVLEVD